MDSKDFTEYLTEFASVNIDAMNSQNTQDLQSTQNIAREEEKVKMMIAWNTLILSNFLLKKSK